MKLKHIVESKDDAHFFDYKSIADEKWDELVEEAHDESGIGFNHENDEKVTQREIVIDQDMWEFTKCKFKCEYRMAGGDWECSTGYFRCQLVDGYAKGHSQYSNPFFCFIPGKDEGNQHLEKTEEGKFTPPDAGGSRTKDEDRPSEKKCWEALKKHLKSLVDEEIESVKKER